MRTFFLLLILWYSSNCLFAQRERPKLIISICIDRSSGYDDKGLFDLYSDHLISMLRSAINKEFPCLIVYTMDDLATSIRHDRDRALLQPDYESNLQDIAGAMGADYLVVVEIKSDGKLTSLSSSLLNPGKGEVKERRNTILKKSGEDVFDEMEDYVKKYVEEMAKSEICPFKGKFSLVTTSALKDEKQNQHSSDDGKYSTSYKYSRVIEEKDIWELDKVSWCGANGDMKHSHKDEEKTTTTSKGRCLRYEDGSWVDIFEGWGNSSENYEQKYKSDISGLANASDMDTKYPAIVEIIFDKKTEPIWFMFTLFLKREENIKPFTINRIIPARGHLLKQ